MGFFKKFCLLIFFIGTSAYSAENINKSLISAYLNNPKINAVVCFMATSQRQSSPSR